MTVAKEPTSYGVKYSAGKTFVAQGLSYLKERHNIKHIRLT